MEISQEIKELEARLREARREEKRIQKEERIHRQKQKKAEREQEREESRVRRENTKEEEKIRGYLAKPQLEKENNGEQNKKKTGHSHPTGKNIKRHNHSPSFELLTGP